MPSKSRFERRDNIKFDVAGFPLANAPTLAQFIERSDLEMRMRWMQSETNRILDNVSLFKMMLTTEGIYDALRRRFRVGFELGEDKQGELEALLSYRNHYNERGQYKYFEDQRDTVEHAVDIIKDIIGAEKTEELLRDLLERLDVTPEELRTRPEVAIVLGIRQDITARVNKLPELDFVREGNLYLCRSRSSEDLH